MMKNNIKLYLIVFFVGITFQVYAQALYKHGIGATIGTTQALSYKTFITNHFAIQIDAGTKYCYVYGSHLLSVELAPNFMFEGRLIKNLYGFLGLGGSVGYTWNNFYGYFNKYEEIWTKDAYKAGANVFLGLEYKLNIPLALQFDFRPGYRCVFNFDGLADHKFDWGLNIGARFTF